MVLVSMTCLLRDFYPRSPCGERLVLVSMTCPLRDFYPRSPCGERLISIALSTQPIRFLSTLSLRRATVHYDNYNLHCVISIHALLAESDYVLVNTFSAIFEFLSTLSLRRATIVMVGLLMCNLYFYPRSPCGERRWLRCWQLAARDISIHALLAESDESTTIITICIALFLSTLSLRRATVTVLGIQHRTGISIHALLAESDQF